jgi:uncharacterized protein
MAAPGRPESSRWALDPGIRTGVKVAMVDGTGKLLGASTIYPHEPRKEWDKSIAQLRRRVQELQRQPDRHRQRHRLARDRQAWPAN